VDKLGITTHPTAILAEGIVMAIAFFRNFLFCFR